MAERNKAPTLLLSGTSTVGKTTACLQLIEMATRAGLQVSGVLALPVFRDGKKSAIRMQDLATGEERPLARLARPGETAEVGVWHFDQETITWGQDLLASLPPADLLVLDEIGPLELNLDQGLTQVLAAARQAENLLTVLTIRPALVERLSERLAGRPLSVIHLTVQNRNTVPNRIFKNYLKKE